MRKRRWKGTVGKRRATGRREAPISRRQKRRTAQLLVAGGIFVVLVGMKLLLPGSVSAFAGLVRREMGQNADFKAAFSAVGEAIAGEKAVGDSLQEAYTAVFAPAEYHAARTAAVFAAGTMAEEPAMRLAREFTAGDGGEEEKTALEADEYTGSQNLIYFAAAPENVSFAQQALGFSYTTPAQGTLTSSFGFREHPIYGEERFHYGLDIAAGKGTEIGAFADGVVKAVGESSSLGKYLMVAHDGGYTTLYAHCDKVVARSGAAVKRGEKIAEMGCSGNATGTHLHFELLAGDTYLNPIYYVEVH